MGAGLPSGLLPPTPLTLAFQQQLEEATLSPLSGQRQREAQGCGVLPDPALILLGPGATGQGRPSSNPCTHVCTWTPSPGVLGYFCLWSLDIFKLHWGRGRRGPAEPLPLVRCFSQSSNNLANMHSCVHLPDWEIETQKTSGRLCGWDDLIALFHHLSACDDKRTLENRQPPHIRTEHNIWAQDSLTPRAPAADSQAL